MVADAFFFVLEKRIFFSPLSLSLSLVIHTTDQLRRLERLRRDQLRRLVRRREAAVRLRRSQFCVWCGRSAPTPGVAAGSGSDGVDFTCVEMLCRTPPSSGDFSGAVSSKIRDFQRRNSSPSPFFFFLETSLPLLSQPRISNKMTEFQTLEICTVQLSFKYLLTFNGVHSNQTAPKRNQSYHDTHLSNGLEYAEQYAEVALQNPGSIVHNQGALSFVIGSVVGSY